METLCEREKLTFHAEFRYLLTLNKVLLLHFLLIIITKEVDSMHKIGNNRFLNIFYFQGETIVYWHFLEYATGP